MEENIATRCYERISLSMLPRYIGKFVTVVGHFGGFENDVLYLKTEGGRIGIVGVETLEDTPSVLEIRGQVNDQGQVDAMEFTDLGADFDLRLYAKVVTLMQEPQFKPLFY